MAYIYAVTFLILLFPSLYAIDKYGCRPAIVFGICSTTTGMILKVFIN